MTNQESKITKSQVFIESISDQLLSEESNLIGITHEDKSGNCTIEFHLGKMLNNIKDIQL